MGYELVTELLPFFAQSCHITKCRKVHKLLLFKCFRSCLPFLLSLSLFYELSPHSQGLHMVMQSNLLHGRKQEKNTMKISLAGKTKRELLTQCEFKHKNVSFKRFCLICLYLCASCPVITAYGGCILYEK